MDTKRHRTILIQDQENIHAIRGKLNVAIPIKKQGLAVRDINTNVQREFVGKVAVAAAEFEKKAIINRAGNTRNYSHVQSKVDTGLASRPTVQPPAQPLPRAPIRREESTAGHAARAAARNKAILKDTENKPAELKNSRNLTGKVETKKPSKSSVLKENKELKALRPILKESTESLGKLKLTGNVSIIRKDKVQQSYSSSCYEDLDVTPVLPDDVEDIDAGDAQNPLLMAIYSKDIYKYLTDLEEKYAIQPDFLRKQTVITGKMRATLIDWLVEVQCQFSLMLETFHMTVGIIDRYLQAVPNIKRDRLQLVGVTAMFICAKYEEIYAPTVEDFVYVTDRAYTKQDIFQCEREILSQLGFFIARPIPLSFLRRFVKAAHGTSKHHHLAKYFVDLCLVEYSMAHYRPSELSAAAVCLSQLLLSNNDLRTVWTPTLAYYSGYDFKHIYPIINKIANVVLNVNQSKCKSVYKKYLDGTLARVSSLPQLKGEVISMLAESASSS